MPSKAPGTKNPSSRSIPHHGAIRIAALAAAAEALKPKPERPADKPAHPLPPCLKDVERQTD